MPLYFFDLDDHERSEDDTGTVLPHLEAARIEAVMFAGAYMRDHPDLVWDGRGMKVMVRAEDKSVLFTVVTLSVDCT